MGECFKQNVLKSDDGVEWFNVTTGLIRDTQKVRIPRTLNGKCTLSWRWDGGCTNCPAGQTSESSLFASCADVEIGLSPSPQPPTPKPTPTPPPTPSPSPTPSVYTCGMAPACEKSQVCCCNPSNTAIGYCADAAQDAACAGNTRCPGQIGCCWEAGHFMSHMI